MIVALAAATALLLALALLLIRLAAGPTLHDRILAAHAIALVVALCIAAIAIVGGQGAWIDAALLFVLTDFVAAIASLKFLRHRSLQAPLARTESAR